MNERGSCEDKRALRRLLLQREHERFWQLGLLMPLVLPNGPVLCTGGAGKRSIGLGVAGRGRMRRGRIRKCQPIGGTQQHDGIRKRQRLNDDGWLERYSPSHQNGTPGCRLLRDLNDLKSGFRVGRKRRAYEGDRPLTTLKIGSCTIT